MKTIVKTGILAIGLALVTIATSCKKDKHDDVTMYGTYSGSARSVVPAYSLDSTYAQNFVVSDLGDSATTMIVIKVTGSVGATLSLSLIDRTQGAMGNVNGIFFNVKNIAVSQSGSTTFNLQGSKHYTNSSTGSKFDGFCMLGSDGVPIPADPDQGFNTSVKTAAFYLELNGSMTISDATPITVAISGSK